MSYMKIQYVYEVERAETGEVGRLHLELAHDTQDHRHTLVQVRDEGGNEMFRIKARPDGKTVAVHADAPGLAAARPAVAMLAQLLVTELVEFFKATMDTLDKCHTQPPEDPGVMPGTGGSFVPFEKIWSPPSEKG